MVTYATFPDTNDIVLTVGGVAVSQFSWVLGGGSTIRQLPGLPLVFPLEESEAITVVNNLPAPNDRLVRVHGYWVNVP